MKSQDQQATNTGDGATNKTIVVANGSGD